MSTHEEHMLRILGEALEPLFASEITERLNRELGQGSVYTVDEVATRLQRLEQKVDMLQDGRWILKRFRV
jgi:hypothetical protein